MFASTQVKPVIAFPGKFLPAFFRSYFSGNKKRLRSLALSPEIVRVFEIGHGIERGKRVDLKDRRGARVARQVRILDQKPGLLVTNSGKTAFFPILRVPLCSRTAIQPLASARLIAWTRVPFFE